MLNLHHTLDISDETDSRNDSLELIKNLVINNDPLIVSINLKDNEIHV